MQVKTQSCVVAGKKTVAVTEQTIDWNNNGTLVQITRGGICGSDLHYYQEGKVGNFMIKAPMVLGHEVIGKVIHSDSSELHEGNTWHCQKNAYLYTDSRYVQCSICSDRTV